MLSIQGLSLRSLQQLLLACPPFGLSDNAKLSKQENGYMIENTTPLFKETINLNALTLRMNQYTYQKNESEKLIVSYSDFEKYGNNYFPKKIVMEIHSTEAVTITLDIKNYTLQDKDEAAFKIPASYSRMD